MVEHPALTDRPLDDSGRQIARMWHLRRCDETVNVAPGRYLAFVTRGPEFSVLEQIVNVESGATAVVHGDIYRETDSTNLAASDFHVHSVFSTDTASALRANEIGVEVILKATKVDGIYDSDPKKNPDAKRYQRTTYLEALQKQLKVMDSTAFSLCMDNKMPIIVFDMFVPHNVRNVVLGKEVGTLVSGS